LSTAAWISKYLQQVLALLISRPCSAKDPCRNWEFKLSSLYIIKTKTITNQECSMNSHTNPPISKDPNLQNQLVNAQSVTNLSHRLRLRFPIRLPPHRLEVITDSAQSSAELFSVRRLTTSFIQHLTYLVDSNSLHCSLVLR